MTESGEKPVLRLFMIVEAVCHNEYGECRDAVQRIMPKISMEEIRALIDQVPYISEIQRRFYKAYIEARYEKLLLPAYRR